VHEIWACFDKHILAISGFIFVNFKRKSGSSSSFDLYLFLSVAEKPVSHRYDVLNGIKKCKALLEINAYSALRFSQKSHNMMDDYNL